MVVALAITTFTPAPRPLPFSESVLILSRFNFMLFYKSMEKFLLIFLFFLSIACSKAVIPPPDGEFNEPILVKPAGQKLLFEKIKEIDFKGFLKTLDLIILELEKNPDKIFSIKEKKFTAFSYSEKLREIKNILEKKDYDNFILYIFENFDLVKITEEGEKTLFTGYYIPLLEAKRERDDLFKYPIYSKPDDIYYLNLSPLGPAFKNLIFIGRIDFQNNLVPYYSRKEIDKEGALKNKKLELGYLKDPLDVLLLQIQGSGFLRMEDGKILLASYAGKNGRQYKSIGKYLSENNYLPKEEVSWKNIREFLINNPDKFDDVIYHNESYVFFNLKENAEVIGSSTLPLVPFHSIAVDKNFIPLLSLCFINFSKPVVGEDDLVKEFKYFTELAFAMDEGSAIKGRERIDLFCGYGEEAEKVANVLKSEGELYLFVPH